MHLLAIEVRAVVGVYRSQDWEYDILPLFFFLKIVVDNLLLLRPRLRLMDKLDEVVGAGLVEVCDHVMDIGLSVVLFKALLVVGILVAYVGVQQRFRCILEFLAGFLKDIDFCMFGGDNEVAKALNLDIKSSLGGLPVIFHSLSAGTHIGVVFKGFLLLWGVRVGHDLLLLEFTGRLLLVLQAGDLEEVVHVLHLVEGVAIGKQ
jgi:hypothetical protein